MAEVTSRDLQGFGSVEDLKIVLGFVLGVKHYNYFSFLFFFFFFFLSSSWLRKGCLVLGLELEDWFYFQHTLWSQTWVEKARNGDVDQLQAWVFRLYHALRCLKAGREWSVT